MKYASSSHGLRSATISSGSTIRKTSEATIASHRATATADRRNGTVSTPFQCRVTFWMKPWLHRRSCLRMKRKLYGSMG